MIKKYLATMLGAAVLVAAAATSQASLITGSVTFIGGATLGDAANATTTDLSAATQVKSWVNPGGVLSVDGILGTTITAGSTPVVFSLAPWKFSYAGPTAKLWSAGGFDFFLETSTVYSQSSSFLNVTGMGYMVGNGYDQTMGTWSFTIPSGASNGKFSFAAASAAVPEPSTVVAGALLLLPFGMSTVRILRKSKVS